MSGRCRCSVRESESRAVERMGNVSESHLASSGSAATVSSQLMPRGISRSRKARSSWTRRGSRSVGGRGHGRPPRARRRTLWSVTAPRPSASAWSTGAPGRGSRCCSRATTTCACAGRRRSTDGRRRIDRVARTPSSRLGASAYSGLELARDVGEVLSLGLAPGTRAFALPVCVVLGEPCGCGRGQLRLHAALNRAATRAKQRDIRQHEDRSRVQDRRARNACAC